ncbi:mitochondrial distribution and morphology proteins-domain-containing protein [Lactarius hatsudake]|nr:mitochondrial distribution and morphology proteins-domain-containing protein [Lactarius hatsudake]
MFYDVDSLSHSHMFLDLLGTTSLMLQMVLSGRLWRMVLGTWPLDPDWDMSIKDVASLCSKYLYPLFTSPCTEKGHRPHHPISNYLTPETGVTTILESAIVNGRWPNTDANRIDKSYDISNHPANHTIDNGGDSSNKRRNSDEDIKWSMFYLNQWLDGKGDAVIKGVRGVLAQQGNFELESLTLEDVLVTVYQPGGFQPYTFSIFHADLGMLHKQWLFYDFLKAEGIVGQFNNCLFSLHCPQSIGRMNEQDGGWSMMIQSRFRIDSINIDHLQAMTAVRSDVRAAMAMAAIRVTAWVLLSRQSEVGGSEGEGGGGNGNG